MLFERYTKLANVVPEVPEIHLESCSNKSSITRELIIQKQRIITLIPLIHEEQYPTNLIPPRKDLFSALHICPDYSSDIIMPQQLQFITFLVSFIKSHPDIVAKALEAQFNDTHNKFFVFMCYSVIPSFFGFFSSSELITNGFSFYCSLVSLCSNERIIDQALIPFFCNSCTFRFIEMIYYRFGLKFCHDSRLESKQIQKEVLRKYYTEPLIDSIIKSYPLIPHTHKFILKYMISNGRNSRSVLHFFLHRFAFPQLLRYFKRTSFTSHFIQLKSLMMSLRDDISPCLKIIDIFDSPSLFEVPSMFNVFDVQFTQLLLTAADVHIMMQALESVCDLPLCLRSFKETSYFSEIKFVPFWVKVFSRSPKPPSAAFNWRPVVFDQNQKESENEKDDAASSEESLKKKKKPSQSTERPMFAYNYEEEDDDDDDENENENCVESGAGGDEEKKKEREGDGALSGGLFERFYLEISSRCISEDVRTINFLTNSFSSVSLHIYRDHVMKLLGPSCRDKFFEFALKREVDSLVDRSESFELYLVHSLSLQTMMQWRSAVLSNYTMMVLPIIHTNMNNFLKKRINPNCESIQKAITESLDGLNDPPIFVAQTLFMMAVQNVLNSAVPSNVLKKLTAIEKLWEKHLYVNNKRVIKMLPKVFQTTALLNQKLREAIEHLKCIENVKFEWSLNLIIEALSQFDEMIKYDTGDNSILQFALVSCNNVNFISKFIVINIFVIRQKNFKVMENESRDTYLWSRLESSILKLMASDVDLLTKFVKLQDELAVYQIA